MLLRTVEATRFNGPVEFMAWLVAAAIIAILAISAAVFIAECLCEWRSRSEASPNNPFCGAISRRPRLRRSRLA